MGGLAQDLVSSSMLPYLNVSRKSTSIDNRSTGTTIHFASVDLRPRAAHRLARVLLLVGADHAGDILHGTWEATATNVAGVATGTVEIPIAEEAVDAIQLLCSSEKPGSAGDSTEADALADGP
jgi:hypothetical protein